jgi:peptidyl-prolyl cis-trans isomerase B (cyclophilin B)
MYKITTSVGDITIKLDETNTPITADNFKTYVSEGLYDNTIFHRVIDGFMIQGGGMTHDLKSKTTKEPIINEAQHGKPNKRGTIAMARTNAPHSATSQFFINLVDNNFLNFKSADLNGYGYCVFGEVTSGMDVVDKIAKVKTGHKNGHSDVPDEPITILKITKA